MAILRTMVVNLHKSSYTKYIGRGSKFGNKYQVGWYYREENGGGIRIECKPFTGACYITREIAIELHRKDFYDNPELQEAVWNELKGQTLGCFCKPKACHGDTYVEYIRNRIKENNEQNKKD